MRLIKLLSLCALGYLVYEFSQGLIYGSNGGSKERQSGEDLHRALNRDPGRMNMSGPGRGTTVRADDFDGGRTNHLVGRGVVSR